MRTVHKTRNSWEKGVTLIEITIALALIGLVMAMVFSFNDTGARVFKHSQIQVQNQADVRIPIEFASKELRVADKVTILTAEPSTHADNEFYLHNGTIVHYKNGALSAIPGVQTVTDYTFSVTKIASDRLRIVVGKAGTSEYDVATEIQVLNIVPAGISGPVGTAALGLRFTQTAAMSSGGPTLVSVDSPADATVPQYSAYMMPSTAVSHFSDGSTSYLPVLWSGGVDTSVAGDVTITGTVATFTVHHHVTVTATSIASIAPITDTVLMEEAYAMPNPIPATMGTTPPSTQMVAVVWNPASIDTSTPGSKTSEGTVAGYTPKVSLSVSVTNQLPAPSASKSGGNVTVTGKPGAIAVLLKSNGSYLMEHVLDAGGSYTFTGAASAGKVYLKKTGWTNSATVAF